MVEPSAKVSASTTTFPSMTVPVATFMLGILPPRRNSRNGPDRRATGALILKDQRNGFAEISLRIVLRSTLTVRSRDFGAIRDASIAVAFDHCGEFVMHTGGSIMSESISPLRGGTQASSLQARADILKDAFAGNWLHFSLDNLSVPSLRLFQPGALDVGVSRTIKFGDQCADQLGLGSETQGFPRNGREVVEEILERVPS